MDNATPTTDPAAGSNSAPENNTPSALPVNPETPRTEQSSAGALEVTSAPAPLEESSAAIARQLREEVGLSSSVPTKNTPPITPQAPKLDDVHPSGVLEEDIANILKEVKLPNRNEFRATADIPPPTPPPEKPAPPQEKPTEAAPAQPAEKNPVVPLHTLKDDLQTVVHDKKISLVSAVALEEEKKARRDKLVSAEAVQNPQRKRTVNAVIISVVFVALGLGALGAVLFTMRGGSGSVNTPPAAAGLLFSEQTIPFSIGNQSASELKRALGSARSAPGPTLGAITRLVPTVAAEGSTSETPLERPASISEFLTAIEAHPPADLLRAFEEEFFFGIHTVDENAPILVIQVNSYERAFAGMLAWERAINADLIPIFTNVPLLAKTPDGQFFERKFEDLIMRNYDVRALKDESGTIQLYYSFPTRDLLIIAESPYSFVEILSRLRAERRL